MWNKISRFSVLAFFFSFALVLFAGDDALKALLIDLEGWEADDAEVVKVEAMGMTSLTATRDYEQGRQEMTVTLVHGTGGMMAGIDAMSGMGDISVETDDSSAKVKTINGFQVTMAYDEEDESGQIVVHLATGMVLAVEYESMTPDDALALAEKFDWQKMKDAME